MINRLVKWWHRAGPWVRAMRFYRNSEYDRFFITVGELEKLTPLTPYQLAVKGNALLLNGKYKEALSVFTILSSNSNDKSNDTKYVAAYSRAMIADINGKSDEFDSISQAAVRIPAKRILKRNLPLPRTSG